MNDQMLLPSTASPSLKRAAASLPSPSPSTSKKPRSDLSLSGPSSSTGLTASTTDEPAAAAVEGDQTAVSTPPSLSSTGFGELFWDGEMRMTDNALVRGSDTTPRKTFSMAALVGDVSFTVSLVICTSRLTLSPLMDQKDTLDFAWVASPSHLSATPLTPRCLRSTASSRPSFWTTTASSSVTSRRARLS